MAGSIASAALRAVGSCFSSCCGARRPRTGVQENTRRPAFEPLEDPFGGFTEVAQLIEADEEAGKQLTASRYQVLAEFFRNEGGTRFRCPDSQQKLRRAFGKAFCLSFDAATSSADSDGNVALVATTGGRPPVPAAALRSPLVVERWWKFLQIHHRLSILPTGQVSPGYDALGIGNPAASHLYKQLAKLLRTATDEAASDFDREVGAWEQIWPEMYRWLPWADAGAGAGDGVGGAGAGYGRDAYEARRAAGTGGGPGGGGRRRATGAGGATATATAGTGTDVDPRWQALFDWAARTDGAGGRRRHRSLSSIPPWSTSGLGGADDALGGGGAGAEGSGGAGRRRSAGDADGPAAGGGAWRRTALQQRSARQRAKIERDQAELARLRAQLAHLEAQRAQAGESLRAEQARRDAAAAGEEDARRRRAAALAAKDAEAQRLRDQLQGADAQLRAAAEENADLLAQLKALQNRDADRTLVSHEHRLRLDVRGPGAYPVAGADAAAAEAEAFAAQLEAQNPRS